jgi:hypothetical protein
MSIRPKLSSGIIVVAVALLAPARLAAQGATVKIPDGTPVRLALLDSLSSATNHADDVVNLEVTEEVRIGPVIAIPRGATARGHVVTAEPKRRMGRAGKLNFTVDYVKGPDGSNVRVRASSNRQGQDKTGTVIIGSVLVAPVFLIMRGKDVEIPRGTAFNAYVDGDREVNLGGVGAGLAPAAAPAQPVAAQPAPRSAAAPVEVAAEDMTTVVVKSTPDGADVTVDGKYMGSTPSTLRLAPGDHAIVIEKSGYKTWQRTMSVNPGGIVTIDATLARP